MQGRAVIPYCLKTRPTCKSLHLGGLGWRGLAVVCKYSNEAQDAGRGGLGAGLCSQVTTDGLAAFALPMSTN